MLFTEIISLVKLNVIKVLCERNGTG